MLNKKDHIKEGAEKILGTTIHPKAWTPELRARWKAALHVFSYGAAGIPSPATKRRTPLNSGCRAPKSGTEAVEKPQSS